MPLILMKFAPYASFEERIWKQISILLISVCHGNRLYDFGLFCAILTWKFHKYSLTVPGNMFYWVAEIIRTMSAYFWATSSLKTLYAFLLYCASIFRYCCKNRAGNSKFGKISVNVIWYVIWYIFKVQLPKKRRALKN